ncbi:chromosome segregation protein SMC [Halalkaliarchaeum desulfuricum]|uniref:Chromosome segregation protein SMC n=1 Tax=Halalkaliarchaeum desulfuricum TaxID=2055893 RepID=A0A343TGQ3_9EURY|nr:chromosome segregation protein SMC [Halalkaliarchaeum desulfuricum]
MDETLSVTAENVGGIDRTEVTLPSGVAVLTGRNATNRTSFLQALMAAFGSEKPSLKADADEGSVELQLGSETYTRTLTRRNGTVAFGGDPYFEDPELADLFAFLLEDNEARRAIQRGDDLREVIMRPVDTAEIERQIDELETEKREIDQEISRLERFEEDLPELESKKRSLETELEETREELAEVESELEGLDADIEESRTRKEELEELFSEIRDAQSRLEDVEFEIETERATIQELSAEREELRADTGDALDDDRSVEQLEGRIEELRDRKRALDGTIGKLQSVISFNEELLEGDDATVERVFQAADAADRTDDGAITDELLSADTTVCWTCGSEVEVDRIDGTLDRLRDLRKDQLSQRNELEERIDDLTTERKQLRQQQRQQERNERRLERIETELESSRERIETLEEKREALESEIEELEAQTDSFEETDYSEVLDRHRKANRLELEVGRLENELQSVVDDIQERENATDAREELSTRREEITDDLADLRTRVDRLEAEAVESFNEHIDAILEILEYENIDRIWIDRREETVREGRRSVERTAFDLHVVRSADGTAYRDTVDNLSESEREVTGLVFALAGYLVHDVHEMLPVMLLDSLEAIDSERIAAVVDYFEEYVDHLVIALLPEDAQALSEEYTYVTEI